MEEKDLNLFNISNEILIYEIIYRLDIISINNLCLCNSKLHNICNDELLWKIKTKNDYNNQHINKPNDTNWRQYYIVLYKSKHIPIYQNGDIIAYVNYNRNLIQLMINQLKQYLNKIKGEIHIVLIDHRVYPQINGIERDIPEPQFKTIIIIKYSYSGSEIIIRSRNYNNVTRGLLILNNSHSRLPRVYMQNIKGKKNKKHQYIDTKYGNYIPAIYSELTSFYGILPIYGIISRDNKFYIIDRTPHKSSSLTAIKVRDELNINNLVRILSMFGINNINKDEKLLCFMVKNKLSEIGHIINE